MKTPKYTRLMAAMVPAWRGHWSTPLRSSSLVRARPRPMLALRGEGWGVVSLVRHLVRRKGTVVKLTRR